MTKTTKTKVPYNMDKATADALSAQEAIDALENAEQEALALANEVVVEAESTVHESIATIGNEIHPDQANMLEIIKHLQDQINDLKKPKKKNHSGGNAQYICHLGPIPLKQVKDIVDMAVAEGKMISLNGRWLSLTEALDGMSLPPHVPLTAVVEDPMAAYYKS